jgi:hypothetical protein
MSSRYCYLLATKQTAVPVWHIRIAVCTVLDSWWTEKLSETCRVLSQKWNKFEKLLHLVGFTIEIYCDARYCERQSFSGVATQCRLVKLIWTFQIDVLLLCKGDWIRFGWIIQHSTMRFYRVKIRRTIIWSIKRLWFHSILSHLFLGLVANNCKCD